MLLSESIQHSIRLITKKQMGTPLLLFLIGHQPLAFVCGQLFHLFNPVVALFGYGICREWATLFSDPTGLAQVENFIEQEIDQQ